MQPFHSAHSAWKADMAVVSRMLNDEEVVFLPQRPQKHSQSFSSAPSESSNSDKQHSDSLKKKKKTSKNMLIRALKSESNLSLASATKVTANKTKKEPPIVPKLSLYSKSNHFSSDPLTPTTTSQASMSSRPVSRTRSWSEASESDSSLSPVRRDMDRMGLTSVRQYTDSSCDTDDDCETPRKLARSWSQGSVHSDSSAGTHFTTHLQAQPLYPQHQSLLQQASIPQQQYFGITNSIDLYTPNYNLQQMTAPHCLPLPSPAMMIAASTNTSIGLDPGTSNICGNGTLSYHYQQNRQYTSNHQIDFQNGYCMNRQLQSGKWQTQRLNLRYPSQIATDSDEEVIDYDSIWHNEEELLGIDVIPYTDKSKDQEFLELSDLDDEESRENPEETKRGTKSRFLACWSPVTAQDFAQLVEALDQEQIHQLHDGFDSVRTSHEDMLSVCDSHKGSVATCGSRYCGHSENDIEDKEVLQGSEKVEQVHDFEEDDDLLSDFGSMMSLSLADDNDLELSMSLSHLNQPCFSALSVTAATITNTIDNVIHNHKYTNNAKDQIEEEDDLCLTSHTTFSVLLAGEECKSSFVSTHCTTVTQKKSKSGSNIFAADNINVVSTSFKNASTFEAVSTSINPSYQQQYQQHMSLPRTLSSSEVQRLARAALLGEEFVPDTSFNSTHNKNTNTNIANSTNANVSNGFSIYADAGRPFQIPPPITITPVADVSTSFDSSNKTDNSNNNTNNSSSNCIAVSPQRQSETWRQSTLAKRVALFNQKISPRNLHLPKSPHHYTGKSPTKKLNNNHIHHNTSNDTMINDILKRPSPSHRATPPRHTRHNNRSHEYTNNNVCKDNTIDNDYSKDSKKDADFGDNEDNHGHGDDDDDDASVFSQLNN